MIFIAMADILLVALGAYVIYRFVGLRLVNYLHPPVPAEPTAPVAEAAKPSVVIPPGLSKDDILRMAEELQSKPKRAPRKKKVE
jgi:hypothetical protein